MRWILSFAVSLAAVSMAAVATEPAESSDQVFVDTAFINSGLAQSRLALHQFAMCTAARYEQDARAAISKQLDLNQIKHEYPRLLDMSCFSAAWFRSKAMSLGDVLYQSMLAEFLLSKDFNANGAALPSLAKVSGLEHVTLPELQEARIPKKYLYVFRTEWALHRLDLVSECISRNAAGSVLKLVQSKQDSEEEARELTSLKPVMIKCNAATLNFEPPKYLWRAWLSTNLYRLVDAARLSGRVEGGSGA